MKVIKTRLLSVNIFIILLIVLLCQDRSWRIYEHKYYEKAGITGGHKYEHIIETKGLPACEIRYYEDEVFSRHMFYKHYELYLGSNDMLGSIRTTDPNYKIGKRNISIGSSLKQVKSAYRWIKTIQSSRYIQSLRLYRRRDLG